MLSWLNAIRPPMSTATNIPTIRKRRLTARATRRSIQVFSLSFFPARRSAAGRRAVDEQAAFGDHLLAGLQIAGDLDEIAIDETDLDLAQLDRLVLACHPEADLVGFVDQGLLRYRRRGAIAGRIDRDVREHLRLQQTVLVVDGGADQQAAGVRIDRGGDVVDLGGQGAARERHHVDADVLPDAHGSRIALAHEGGEPDRGEVADDEDRIAGARIDVLAGADLTLHDRARDRRIDRDFRIDDALVLERLDGLVGEAEDTQLVARGFQRRRR